MERPDASSLLAASAHAHKKPSYEPRKPLQITPEEAHIMWGHAGRQAIDRLPDSVDGLQLVDGNPAPNQRPPREPATRPFERINVVFIRGKLCDGKGQYAEKSYVQEAAEVLDIKEALDYSNILTEQLFSRENKDNAEGIGDTVHVQLPPNYQQSRTQQKNTTALMTPEATPDLPEPIELTGESLTDQAMDDTGWGRGYALAREGEEPDRTSNNAARRGEISSQVSEQFIMKGKRIRKPATFGTYLATFAACINPTAAGKLLSEAPKTRLHRDQLPAELKR
ncbi:uncharacterized protein M421DRAFT_2670 [Didymella exigua CBS 183.55]|uniref:Uncharacterized protein n=1 Tax=Didymella exigua CBS 183.55 TaxID=1150837 RepID=A0A6A5RVZ1_9PLEO|nr:uncharacterized protein M421DRAFT_2670 [Didymella exigua CBS 183.55]KAF1931148.1 hypothetical protein M421DRAFT_2670 [Didymella exigua CBS 183.55]